MSRQVFLLAVGLLAAGCVSLPRELPGPGGFALSGKLGVVQGDESFSARFLWRQTGERFAIDLWGPLGQGRVALSGSDRSLALTDGDGSVIDQGRPQAVMERHLGWSLPLDALPEWVQGRPAPGLPVAQRRFDEAGRLTAFSQLDWQIELERFQPVAEADAAAPGRLLPHRITAVRNGYRVRLAVSAWQI